MTETIKLPRALALDLMGAAPVVTGSAPEPIGGYVYMDVQEGESRRWMRRCELVIRRLSDGQLFASHFERGLTENQPNDFWGSDSWDPEDGAALAEFYPVEKVAVTTCTYRAVKD